MDHTRNTESYHDATAVKVRKGPYIENCEFSSSLLSLVVRDRKGHTIWYIHWTESLQNFAHAMTTHMLYHVQNFIAITSVQLGWEQNYISMEFELLWKWNLWNGPVSIIIRMYGMYVISKEISWNDIEGLVQERRNSSALAMELRLSCTNPSTWYVCTWGKIFC